MIRFEGDGSGGIEAVSDVEVGVQSRSIRVPLGPWNPSETDAEGLRSVPVVATIDDRTTHLIVAGVRRAGSAAVAATRMSGEEYVGAWLLAAARNGAEVLLMTGASGSLLDQVAALRGQAIPALSFGRPEALDRLLAGSTLEVTLPIPAAEGQVRVAIRERIATLSLDGRYHLVEVDARPAFEEAGLSYATSDLDALGAAAAGVLAGRLAAANRRWRDAD